MDNNIVLSDSLLAYLDRGFATAIERIGELKGPPGELTIDECVDYHLAKLMFDKLRTDYWLFLRDIWNACWRPEVGVLAPVPVGDEVWADDKYHLLPQAWESSEFGDWRRTEGGNLVYTCVSGELELEGNIWIYANIYDERVRVIDTSTVKFPEGWAKPDEDSGRYTKDGLVTLSESPAVDVSPLARLASGTLQLLSGG